MMRTLNPAIAVTLLVAPALRSGAQIIYTDVVPDSTYTSDDTCFLDLNNDGTTDFTIRYYRQSGFACSSPSCPVHPSGLHPSWVRIDALPDAAVANPVTSPSALDSLAPIDAALIWNSSSDQVMAMQTSQCLAPYCVPNLSTGEWRDGTSVDSARYLGLRFSVSGSTYYGWARWSIGGSPGLQVNAPVLKDYAYNSVPGEMILAGDTGSISTGSHTAGSNAEAIFLPNPFTSSATLVLPQGAFGTCQLRFTDLSGRVLRMMEISGERTVIDRGLMEPGSYLYDIATGGRYIATGRIVVE